MKIFNLSLTIALCGFLENVSAIYVYACKNYMFTMTAVDEAIASVPHSHMHGKFAKDSRGGLGRKIKIPLHFSDEDKMGVYVILETYTNNIMDVMVHPDGEPHRGEFCRIKKIEDEEDDD
ncbi:CSEP0184 putative effector protein [Blumeria hordei DH14]|uniref:CSEP0184 putative effector protein n=1 Tax=Blumeria graminis f. sp. hordei (strain DH14) TaxID=546991 RepID=N1JKB2_BLUG1|nr:CSEP0184 putative effector protein [Blumeria hordei DH14]